jgi:hypothetical protein
LHTASTAGRKNEWKCSGSERWVLAQICSARVLTIGTGTGGTSEAYELVRFADGDPTAAAQRDRNIPAAERRSSARMGY